jgi:hypothetical protein
MQRLVVAAVLLGGCNFSIKGLEGGGKVVPVDGGVFDLAEPSVPVGGADMAQAFVPSHVDPGALHPGASDLPSGITAIDTSALTINGAAPPTGVAFATGPAHADWAVLSIGGWTVDKNVRVTGTRALVVVAARKVDIAAIIDASATLRTPGPGATLSGNGGDGVTSNNYLSGGGGAGFGSAGAQGGDSTQSAGGAAGNAFGSSMSFFGGGSAGGLGAGATQCGSNDSTHGRGGGGGGAVQISSAHEIYVEASGGINVAGGGGSGGCGSLASAGGGGGSGGMIFLEAPSLTVLGKLGANGGGGGGGASDNGSNDGSDGNNGALQTTPAGGGSAGGGGFLTSSNGGGGGNGAAGASGATRGAKNDNGGGSGGGVGRIWMRTAGASTPVIGGSSMLSPTPMIDGTL